MKGNHARVVFFSFVLFAVALAAAFSWPSKHAPGGRALVEDSSACVGAAQAIPLDARAAFAEDLSTGEVLYQKRPDLPLPLASLTKLMTAFVASGILAPEDVVTITREDLAPEGDAGFREGERWTAQALTDYTLMVSANDGARALANAAAKKEGMSHAGFIARMNETARALGMYQTFYASDTGLDVSSTTAGSYGTARDLATLLARMLAEKPRLLSATKNARATFVSLSGFSHRAENTSTVASDLSGAIAQKTGYTDLAGGNLADVFEALPGRPIVAVVLGSTLKGRDADMETLAAFAESALKRMLLCEHGAQSP